MADENTHGDAIRVYLTGADTHQGAQSDPDLSLGKHLSSTEIQVLNWEITDPIGNIDVELVSGQNGEGEGSLTASSVNGLKWTPPGASQGVEVTIANGETKLIEGDDAEKYVRVTRTSATDLTGTATLTITNLVNNIFDDVSSAERTAGDDEYRCLGFKNVSAAEAKNCKVYLSTLGTQRTTDAAQLPGSGAGTIQTTGSFADWPEVGWARVQTNVPALREVVYYSSRTATTLTVPAAGRACFGSSAAAGAATDTVDAIPGIAIGKDAPSSQPNGTFVDNTGAGEDTAPGGISFSCPVTNADGEDCGDLAATYMYGIWFWREVPPGAETGAGFLSDIIIDADTV